MKTINIDIIKLRIIRTIGLNKNRDSKFYYFDKTIKILRKLSMRLNTSKYLNGLKFYLNTKFTKQTQSTSGCGVKLIFLVFFALNLANFTVKKR